MRLIRLAAMALALVSAGTLSGAATRSAPGNWNVRVEVTPSGSHVLGNPAAALKLSEYISYTCSHCANFDREASDRLRIYGIAQGKLSVEVRHLLRDPIDLTVAMLTNCGPPARFFANHTMFLRSQSRWMASANSATAAQQARWNAGSQKSRLQSIATDFGFFEMMAGRGGTTAGGFVSGADVACDADDDADGDGDADGCDGEADGCDGAVGAISGTCSRGAPSACGATLTEAAGGVL